MRYSILTLLLVMLVVGLTIDKYRSYVTTAKLRQKVGELQDRLSMQKQHESETVTLYETKMRYLTKDVERLQPYRQLVLRELGPDAIRTMNQAVNPSRR